MNLTIAITNLARNDADRPAIIDGARTLGYAELDRRIDEAALRLAAFGIGPGDRVGICLKERAEYLIALFATTRLWAVAAPMDWRAPIRERVRIAQGFALDLVICEQDDEAAAIPGGISWDALAARAVASGGALDLRAPEPDPLFLIAPSSGSTGAPKGLAVTHGNQLARVVRLQMGLRFDRDARHLSATPLVHASARNKCIAMLVRGCTVILFPTIFDPPELVAAARRHAATTTYIVPTIARRLLDEAHGPNPLFPTLHHLQIGSGVLTPEERIAAMRKLSPNLFVSYGASGYSTMTMLRPAEIAREPASVGRATYLTELEIVDDDDRPLPTGAEGRLRCRGPGLASEIIGAAPDSAATESIRDGWYYPGDIARLTEAGYLHLVGRIANLIRRGGTTIVAEEVERVLTLHPSVAEAAVIGRPSPTHGQDVVAHIVARGAIAPAALQSHCRLHLAPTKVPTEFVFVEAMPRNAAGKIMRRHLAERSRVDAVGAPQPIDEYR